MTGADVAARAPGGTRGRPVVGAAPGAIGAAHLLAAPFVAGDSLRSILDGGVLVSVDADPPLADLRGRRIPVRHDRRSKLVPEPATAHARSAERSGGRGRGHRLGYSELNPANVP